MATIEDQMNVVRFVNGHWFAYCRTRVLGPFKFEKQAWRALKEEEKDGND